VSRSLLFECDPIDQRGAADPVERLTWCSLRIRVGERYVSRIWDKANQNERTSLYLPVFPIAVWIVQNWWSLLNELCGWETVPRAAVDAAQSMWLKRHCLRSADSSVMLPALYIFHDGYALRAEWFSDPQDSMPNMLGEFVDSGAGWLDSGVTQDSLAQFIDQVLDRVTALDDVRVQDIREHWRAIQAADAEEQAFCTLAGRMGIDPYDSNEMTDELAQFLEQTVTSSEDLLVRDLTEVARPQSIVQQWSWLSSVGTDLQLDSNPVELPFNLPPRESLAPQFGYKLARLVRTAAGVSLESPLNSVESTARDVFGREMRIEDRNHVPGHGILAIIGRSKRNGDIVAAGPQPPREDSQRFLNSRSIYHALVTTGESRRLVTDSFSWDQKASRAFAAELIAPQRALVARLTGFRADSAKIESLSREFNASTIVIEKQLENAGVSVSYE
jgi:hypothetical protein